MSARSRLIVRTGFVAVLGLVAFLLAAGPGRVDAQDPSLKPIVGTKALKVGFAPDPFTVKLTAGGSVKTKKGGVTAWVSKAPDYAIEYTAGKLPLTFYVRSEKDTTLLINLPDGSWVADDDSGGALNPQITFKTPQSGRYDVWVGTIAENILPAATLHVTELK